MNITRCKCRNITNNKVCKRKAYKLYSINNIIMCNLHYKYYFGKYVIIIQKYYRGYKNRKTLNNIYKKLPYDMQYIISKFIREEHYYNNYKKVLNNIIFKKINIIISSLNYNYNIDLNVPFTYLHYINNNYKSIEHAYKLYSKYKSILYDKKYINFDLLIEKEKLDKIINLYEFKIYNIETENMYNNARILYYNIDYILYPNTKLSSIS